MANRIGVFVVVMLVGATGWLGAATADKVPAASPVLAVPEHAGMGQPFLVRLTSDLALEQVTMQWMGKKIVPSVSTWNNRHVALAMLGTDVLTIKPGPQSLEVRAMVGGEERTWFRGIRISSRSYPRQELTLPSKMVTPPESELARIKKERVRAVAAKNFWSDKRMWQLPFHRPVPGKTTSSYGLRRILNKKPKNPHRGLDFRAATGSVVEAVAPGRVILAESHYYAGNSIYIDHGNGVISLYFHLSKFSVAHGDSVKKGQKIGLAGSSGRSTGPHLHLSISVQGELVDPAPLFERSADELLK
ncbi:MAG: M23 family metallopeptidase [Desulfobacterales bacterium]|nr:M23 family metallopeptidase [Desulfobacterales bacterium]